MESIKKEIDVLSVNGAAYAYEKYTNGEPNGDYGFIREIDVTVNSPYGTEATVTLTVDEAKEAVKILQNAIKNASASEKQLIAFEKKRDKQMSAFLGMVNRGKTLEND